MHKIEATVRRFVAQQVRDALMRHGVEGVTMTDVVAAPAAGAAPTFYRGAPYVADVPLTKVEAVVADADTTTVVQTIVSVARTAGSVDGSILVLPIADRISIATGTSGIAGGRQPDAKRPRLRLRVGRLGVGTTGAADGRPGHGG